MICSSCVKWTVLGLIGWVAVGASVASAQRSSRAPAPEEIKLTTRDGVKLSATYYPSSLGKEAVPIIMLHDFKESRTVFNGLAAALQAPTEGSRDSRAVITVDLRGHGESTIQVSRDGRTRDLEASRLKTYDFQAMVDQDMEAVRRFLVEENDAGQLNLNMLCLLGAGMGANVATYWAAKDWSAPRLATLKQGQDVKALILASPEWSFRGLPLLRPLRHPAVRQELSFFIVYGDQDSQAKKDAKTVHKNLVKYHPEPPRDKIKELKDLFMIDLPTKLQGTTLLTSRNFGMLPDLDAFIDARLTQKHFKWVSRKR
ncbi:MAG: alpha/beta hydrolase [Planctomycetes bacterium]|nr:alpha/beta hydrolase [Planctomycetota bacterium]